MKSKTIKRIFLMTIAVTGFLIKNPLANAVTPLPFSAPTKSQPAVPITLEEAVLLVLRNNPTVEQSKIQRIADKFAVIVAKYQFEPQYAFTASIANTHTVSNGTGSSNTLANANPSVTLENHYGTQFKVDSNNPVSNGIYNPSVIFSVTQPLIQGFGRPVVDATLNNALDNEVINQLKLKGSVITAVAQVINDYLTLLQSYQTLAVDQLSLKQYQQTVSDDEALIAAGRMARSDIVLAQAQVQSQQAAIEADLNNIDSNKNVLLNDLGLPPRTNLILPKTLNFDQITNEILGHAKLPDMTISEDVALANDINYQTSLILIRESRRSLLQAKDQNRPTLNAVASEQLGGGSGGGDNSGFRSFVNGTNHEEVVGLNLTVPIDNVNLQQAIVDQEVALEQAMIGLTQQKRQLIEDVDTQYKTVLSSWSTLQLSQQALILQQKAVAIAQEKQLAGQISTFEVITQQKDLASQQQVVVQNEIAYLKSIVAYQQTLGDVLTPWKITIKY